MRTPLATLELREAADVEEPLPFPLPVGGVPGFSSPEPGGFPFVPFSGGGGAPPATTPGAGAGAKTCTGGGGLNTLGGGGRIGGLGGAGGGEAGHVLRLNGA